MNVFDIAQYLDSLAEDGSPLDVDCPDCGALAGQPCRTQRRTEPRTASNGKAV